MDKYTAVTKSGYRIISVMGASAEAAAKRIVDQLDRPGRYAIYSQWVNDGKIMIINDNMMQVANG